MIETKSDAQKEILEAAKNVFTRKGYKGATMRDIAKEAGVNLAMVNYYFRSKDRLFDMIFLDAFGILFAKISASVLGNGSIFAKIENIVDVYIDALIENPLIPNFVLGELARDPERFLSKIKALKEMKKVIEILSRQIEKEAKEGIIRSVDPFELYLNVVSLSVFPFVARPLLNEVTEITKVDCEKFLDNRKRSVTDFVINAIKM